MCKRPFKKVTNGHLITFLAFNIYAVLHDIFTCVEELGARDMLLNVETPNVYIVMASHKQGMYSTDILYKRNRSSPQLCIMHIK